jgi:hypothetical protein
MIASMVVSLRSKGSLTWDDALDAQHRKVV